MDLSFPSLYRFESLSDCLRFMEISVFLSDLLTGPEPRGIPAGSGREGRLDC